MTPAQALQTRTRTPRERAPAPTADARSATPRGLCVTCNHVSACAYAASAQQPTLSCELFDNVDGLHAAALASAALVGGSTAHRAEGADARPVRGLCANCDLWGTCALPRPESGVWHCEEYR